MVLAAGSKAAGFDASTCFAYREPRLREGLPSAVGPCTAAGPSAGAGLGRSAIELACPSLLRQTPSVPVRLPKLVPPDSVLFDASHGDRMASRVRRSVPVMRRSEPFGTIWRLLRLPRTLGRLSAQTSAKWDATTSLEAREPGAPRIAPGPVDPGPPIASKPKRSSRPGGAQGSRPRQSGSAGGAQGSRLAVAVQQSQAHETHWPPPDMMSDI